MKQLFTAIIIILLFSRCAEIVGFLAVTTTSAPQSMKLFLPKDSDEESSVTVTASDSTLTLLLTANKVFYYTGDTVNEKQVSAIGYKDVREVVDYHKKMYGDKIVVIIKPHQNCTYKNTVDILDEMTIHEIKRYALVDLTYEDQMIVKTKL